MCWYIDYVSLRQPAVFLFVLQYHMSLILSTFYSCGIWGLFSSCIKFRFNLHIFGEILNAHISITGKCLLQGQVRTMGKNGNG